MKTRSGKTGFLVLAGVGVLFAGCSMLLFDDLVFRLSAGLPDWIIGPAAVLTALGSLPVLLAGLGVIFTIAAFARKHRAMRGTLFLLAAVGTARALVALLKSLIGRARPTLFEDLGPHHFEFFTRQYDYHSFPSGHAASFVALAVAISLLAPRWRVPLILLGAVLALTRVVVGLHYLSDVIAGGVLAALVTLWLRDWLLRCGWLFEEAEGGRKALRSGKLRLVWPDTIT